MRRNLETPRSSASTPRSESTPDDFCLACGDAMMQIYLAESGVIDTKGMGEMEPDVR